MIQKSPSPSPSPPFKNAHIVGTIKPTDVPSCRPNILACSAWPTYQAYVPHPTANPPIAHVKTLLACCLVFH